MTEYRNTTPQADRLSTLLNDKRVQKDASTFSQFANSDANQDAGRFEQINKSTVVGATPVPEYPRLPENSWTNDPTGVEPPLGFVDETPIVGEVGEVQASIDRLANAAPATQSVHVPDADAVERKEGGATPETSRGPLPPTAPSQDIASPNPSIETTITTDGKRRRL